MPSKVQFRLRDIAFFILVQGLLVVTVFVGPVRAGVLEQALAVVYTVHSADDEDRFLGSAFLWGQGSGAGRVAVTNAHVVGNATDVRLTDADGNEQIAHVIASDPARDVAVLSVKAAEFGKLEVDDIANQLPRLGLSRELSKTDSDLPGTLLPVRAPLDGVVMQVDVIAGEVVDPEDVLFVVADPRQMWVNLNVIATDASWIQIGQAARFRPDGAKVEFTGKVEWIGTSADETTRTIPVRVVMPNADGKLRALVAAAEILRREYA